MKNKPTQGFSLIELMISLTIVGILAAIAVPSYNSYVQKSRRSDAWTTLLRIQQLQEKYRANNTSYGTLAQLGASSTSTESYYAIAATNITASTYTITATTSGIQTADSTCASIVLNQDGPVTSTASEKTCWGK